jgi:hypothetical protein
LVTGREARKGGWRGRSETNKDAGWGEGMESVKRESHGQWKRRVKRERMRESGQAASMRESR